MPALVDLARTVPGPPREALTRLLTVLCQQLGMDVGYVGTIDADGHRTIRVAVTSDGDAVVAAEGRTEPLGRTWCGRVVREGVMLVADASSVPELAALDSTREFSIVSHAGVALSGPDGVLGTLCFLAHSRHGSLNDRDRDTLLALGEVVTEWLVRLDQPWVPAQRAPVELRQVSAAVGAAHDMESLSRPLLDLLQQITGLASTYVTQIHDARDEQEIRYSLNTREGFALPEGLLVPWGDTLCRRALEQCSPVVLDVPSIWGDSAAAQALGIQVYASVPVTLSDGTVWGTLCAADSELPATDVDHLPTLQMFSRLIASEVERAEAVLRAQERVAEAERRALVDPLTGCSTRDVVEPWLSAALAQRTREEVVLVAFADVDDFKGVNDGYGHPFGDRVLVEVAERWRSVSRAGDLVARVGGDEFVLAARVPREAVGDVQERLRAACRLTLYVAGEAVEVSVSLGIVTITHEDVTTALARADDCMYAVKRSRDGRRAPSP